MFKQLRDLQVNVDRAEAETIARYCTTRPLRTAGMWSGIIEAARREADAYARLEMQLEQRPR